MAQQAVENGDDSGGTCEIEIEAAMATNGNSAPKDPPPSEKPGDNLRALVAAIAGAGAVISLATLVEALRRGS
jgi:hypothetical protein